MNNIGSGLLASAMLAAWLSGCSRNLDSNNAPVDATGIRLLSGGERRGFDSALVARAFEFPRDYGAHPTYRNEWWYFTGNLESDAGRHFGFELTFFRYALAPQGSPRESNWASNEVWLAHFSVTDTASERFFAEERIARGALEIAGASTQRFNVWTRDFSASQAGSGDPIVLTARGGQASIELALTPSKPVMLNGDEGLDRKGPEPGNASFYYSIPRFDVTGQLSVDDDATLAVTGLAWLDREWSTSTLADGVEGWDWFALQLSDGRDLMIYELRQTDGQASAFSTGTLSQRDGQAKHLDAGAFELEPLAYWTSGATGVNYPVSWRIRIDSERLDLLVRPRIDNQEVNLSVRYWEGAVTAEGSADGVPVSGEGYLELAGYRSP
jgi:predicted secreted hydrolase